MNKIAIITARAGSKGLVNKNMLMVDGKPLMAYSIEAALEANIFDRIVVTTDSEEYIEALSNYPVDFIKRAAHLATDKSSSFDVLEDVLRREEYTTCDYFVLLQPTSPLRTALHIIEASDRFEQNWNSFDYLVSVSNAHKPTTLTRQIDEDQSLKYFNLDYSRYARQNYAPEYSPNGALFIAKPKEYLQTKQFYGERSLAYFMDKKDSIDIDDREDFEYFYFITQQRKREELLKSQIEREVSIKEIYFSKNQSITFIGGSLLALWDIDSLDKLKVQNIAITASSIKQYNTLVLSKSKLKLSPIVFVDLGRDDLRRSNLTIEEIAQDARDTINLLSQQYPNVTFYILEALPGLFRVDFENAKVKAFNKLLKEHLATMSHANWIELCPLFTDFYGKLLQAYTNDGLNLNKNGYAKLKEVLETLLDKK